jgi:hypothetical protein
MSFIPTYRHLTKLTMRTLSKAVRRARNAKALLCPNGFASFLGLQH